MPTAFISIGVIVVCVAIEERPDDS